MTSGEYDVFVCCSEPAGTTQARMLAEGLTRRGFLVHYETRETTTGLDDTRAAAIDDAPDFILVTAGATFDAGVPDHDPVRLELAHAFRGRRIVVPVCRPGQRLPAAESLPPDIAALGTIPPTVFDPARPKESLALLAHSLSSDAEVEDRRLMRRARRAAALVGLIFVGVVGSFVVPPIYTLITTPKPKPPVAPFAVAWVGFGQRAGERGPVAFDLTDGSEVSAGDRIRLVFSPSADGFAYVLTKSLAGDVAVLFPGQALRGASRVRAGEVYEVPSASSWWPIGDAAGPQVIYVVAGYDPLENLEELAEEPDAGVRGNERLDLLDTTIRGLMDGRHGAASRNPRTRLGHLVDARLALPGDARRGSATLDGGATVSQAFATQRGLVSTAVEIRLRYEIAR